MSEFEDDKTQIHVPITKGTMVAHYRIEEKIGAGGMGEVYLAEDTKLKRKVALKFLPSHLVANKEIRTRFVREAQTVAKLNHPNIVSIFEVSEFNNRPFYVMEWVEGESLHYYCHEKPQPIDVIVDFAIQICQGLGEAHRAGIIHRDIKAANIAVDKNHRIKILDFGLAANEDDDKITKTGSTLGTVAYMSPEQVSGRDIDHRSDLFSFGVVLYELIAGRTPFRRDSEGASLKAIMTDVPEPLTRYRSEVPEKLQQIVSELLEKDKEIRFQSAEGVIAALKRLTYDSMQTGTFRPMGEPKSNKKVLLMTLPIVVVLILVAVYFFFQRETVAVKQKGTAVPMIAVLPFENLGPPEDEYFADGITDEITSRLAGIQGLGVISRSSAVQFKNTDKNLKQIGKELGVQYILEGTVRWSKVGGESKVRITPQLIQVSDDRHLWADNYERSLIEVFAVQADIAEKIVQQLGVTLLANDKVNLLQKPTDDPEAYKLYLKALNIKKTSDWEDEDPKTIIDSVISLDSEFALAYALRSEIYSNMAFGAPNSEFGKIALESAEKSLKLNPSLPQGHLALGYYYNQVLTDYNKALQEYSRAKSEMHNNSDLLNKIAYVYLRQGRFEESKELLQKAVELDPLNSELHLELTQPLRFLRDFKQAEQSINRAIALEPTVPMFYKNKADLMRDWTGDISTIKPIFQEALKHSDTVKVITLFSGYEKYIPEFPWDSVFTSEKDKFLDTAKFDSGYYFGNFMYYSESGNETLAKIYADSAKEEAKMYYEKNYENPFVISGYGMLLSYIGECDKAMEQGEKAKEVLSVDECHY